MYPHATKKLTQTAQLRSAASRSAAALTMPFPLADPFPSLTDARNQSKPLSLTLSLQKPSVYSPGRPPEQQLQPQLPTYGHRKGTEEKEKIKETKPQYTDQPAQPRRKRLHDSQARSITWPSADPPSALDLPLPCPPLSLLRNLSLAIPRRTQGARVCGWKGWKEGMGGRCARNKRWWCRRPSRPDKVAANGCSQARRQAIALTTGQGRGGKRSEREGGREGGRVAKRAGLEGGQWSCEPDEPRHATNRKRRALRVNPLYSPPYSYPRPVGPSPVPIIALCLFFLPRYPPSPACPARCPLFAFPERNY